MRVSITVDQSTWQAIRAAIYAPAEMSDATALECVLADLRVPTDGHASAAETERRREVCLD